MNFIESVFNFVHTYIFHYQIDLAIKQINKKLKIGKIQNKKEETKIFSDRDLWLNRGIKPWHFMATTLYHTKTSLKPFVIIMLIIQKAETNISELCQTSLKWSSLQNQLMLHYKYAHFNPIFPITYIPMRHTFIMIAAV